METESTINRLKAAFNRLKIDEPQILDKGTKTNVSTVQKEAGFTLGTMSRKKHSKLYEEVNEYKNKLKNLKAMEDGIEESSKEDSLKNRIKAADKLRAKYYTEKHEAEEQLKRQQEKEVMVLQAMFELLDVYSKDKLIKAGNKPDTETGIVKFKDIKKAKLK